MKAEFFNQNKTYEPLMAETSQPKNEESIKISQKQTNIRPEIQTLRAIAIIAVLLFHLWEEKFYFGFLGVDIFFVISGYLMYLILNKKQSITLIDILIFYERRFKRIVPLYLFVISLTLFLLFYVVSEIHFHQIIHEAIRSMFFTSNIPSSEQKDYFDVDSRFYFFLHTWSLSVEIQFYFLVPFIFLIFDLIKKYFGSHSNIINTSLILLTIYLSFMHQVFIKDSNAKYMSLLGRVWQFFFGFMAFKIRDKYIGQDNNILNNTVNIQENNTLNNSLKLKIRKALYFLVLTLLLIVLFCDIKFELFAKRQFNRLIAIILTTYIVAESNQLPKLMGNKVLVILGDISYSVYLVHWLLITWYRYNNMGASDEIDLLNGIGLIIISILIGFIIEKLFRFILKYIKTWYMLLFVIALGYYISALLLFRLEHSSIKIDNSLSDEITAEDWKIMQIPLKLKSNETLEVPANQTKEEMLQNYNHIMREANLRFNYCPNKNATPPTNYKLDLDLTANIYRFCSEKGNGTKNIVIIGNSHASFKYVGIAEKFRPLYKKLTLFARHICMPTSLQPYADSRLKNVTKDCPQFIQQYTPILEQWKEPIDILIVQFGLIKLDEVPIEGGNITTDKFVLEMNEFYQNLSQIPKEAMIIQGASPYFKDSINDIFMSKIKTGQDYMNIGESRKSVVEKTPTMFQRINAVDCGKNCLKMNWLDFWCGENEDGYCQAMDQKTGLENFIDQSHTSPWGAIKEAEFMLKEYKSFVKNNTVFEWLKG